MGLSSKSRSLQVSLLARHPPKYSQRSPLFPLRGMANPSRVETTIRSCTARRLHHDLCRYRRVVRERRAFGCRPRLSFSMAEKNSEPLLTTDYIIDETLTLLRARGESMRAIRMGEQFFGGALAKVYFLTEDDILATWEVFRKFSDKDWSFTDCSSKVVMERRESLERSVSITISSSLDRLLSCRKNGLLGLVGLQITSLRSISSLLQESFRPEACPVGPCLRAGIESCLPCRE